MKHKAGDTGFADNMFRSWARQVSEKYASRDNITHSFVSWLGKPCTPVYVITTRKMLSTRRNLLSRLKNWVCHFIKVLHMAILLCECDDLNSWYWLQILRSEIMYWGMIWNTKHDHVILSKPSFWEFEIVQNWEEKSMSFGKWNPQKMLQYSKIAFRRTQNFGARLGCS